MLSEIKTIWWVKKDKQKTLNQKLLLTKKDSIKVIGT
jgi:hypothetical protein